MARTNRTSQPELNTPKTPPNRSRRTSRPNDKKEAFSLKFGNFDLAGQGQTAVYVSMLAAGVIAMLFILVILEAPWYGEGLL